MSKTTTKIATTIFFLVFVIFAGYISFRFSSTDMSSSFDDQEGYITVTEGKIAFSDPWTFGVWDCGSYDNGHNPTEEKDLVCDNGHIIHSYAGETYATGPIVKISDDKFLFIGGADLSWDDNSKTIGVVMDDSGSLMVVALNEEIESILANPRIIGPVVIEAVPNGVYRVYASNPDLHENMYVFVERISD